MDILYGRVEVRAKLPAGLGTWPAIWMLPTDSIYGFWPPSGEIDIMEAVNLGTFGAPNRVFSTTHYGLPFPQNTFVSESYDDFSVLPQDDFHVYEVEWQAGQLRFYVDGVHYHSQNSITGTPTAVMSTAWPRSSTATRRSTSASTCC